MIEATNENVTEKNHLGVINYANLKWTTNGYENKLVINII